MVLKIDYDVFRLVMAEKEEYVFDAVTYAICEKGSEEAEFFDYPIPMPFTEKMELYSELQKIISKNDNLLLTNRNLCGIL